MAQATMFRIPAMQQKVDEGGGNVVIAGFMLHCTINGPGSG